MLAKNKQYLRRSDLVSFCGRRIGGKWPVLDLPTNYNSPTFFLFGLFSFSSFFFGSDDSLDGGWLPWNVLFLPGVINNRILEWTVVVVLSFTQVCVPVLNDHLMYLE